MQLIKNMLLLNHGLPQFNLFKVDLVESTISSLLENQHEKFLSLEKDLSFLNENFDKGDIKENTDKLYDLAIYESEKIDHSLDYAWSIVSHLKSVKNNDELREVYDKCLPELVKESSYVSQSLPLFNSLKKLSLSGELSPVKQRIIDAGFKSMYLSGIDLDDDKKKRFNEIKIRLSELSTKFSNNILDSVKEYEMIIDSENKFMKKNAKICIGIIFTKCKEKIQRFYS